MNKIKYFRQNLGLTVKELSEQACVAVGYVSDLENDEEGAKNPSRDVMSRIAEVLGETLPAVFFPKYEEESN